MRKLIVRQINFGAKIESSQYQSCLENLNYSMLKNIDEIRAGAKKNIVDNDE
jgi:hypothetical protein